MRCPNPQNQRGSPHREDYQVTEVSLALPEWQLIELQKAAAERNLTVAQLFRLLAGQFLAQARQQSSTNQGYARESRGVYPF